MTTEPVVEPTLDDPVDPSPTPTEPSGDDPVQAEPSGDPATPDPSDPKPTEPTKGAEPSGAEKRIKELVAKQRQAEREADYWKGVAEGRIKPNAEPEPRKADAPKGKPVITDFENYDDYMEALTDWKVDQKLQARKTEDEKSKTEQTAQQKREAFNQKILEASEEDPDVLEYYHDQTLPISPAMAEVLLESEASPQLLKYLGDNRKEAARISKLSPIAAVKELGKIEDRILNPPQATTKKVSQAPEPISTVQPKGRVKNPYDDDAPIDEFMRAENAKRQPARRK